MKKNCYILVANFLLLISVTFTGCNRSLMFVTAGYTRGSSVNGLSVFNFNTGNGDLSLISESDAGPNPSYLSISKRNGLIYAVNEVRKFNDLEGGGLTTLKYNAEGSKFTKKHEMMIPYGGPVYVSMSSDGGFLFIANYSKGSVAVVKLDPSTGLPQSISDTILYVKGPPDVSRAHMVTSDPLGKRVYVSDLALNRVVVYEFDKTRGKLIQNEIIQVPEGSGPRHMAFKPDGSKLYLINEHGSNIMVFNIDDKRGHVLLQTVPTLSEGYQGKNTCADIHVSKDGRFLYGSNRGENTIVTFAIDENGLLKLAGRTPCGGNMPRNFVLDPTGKYVLVGNQRSDNISVFRINKTTGLPEEPPKQFKVKEPACLKFY